MRGQQNIGKREKTLCLPYQDKSSNPIKGNECKVFHIGVVKAYESLELSHYSFSTSALDGGENPA